MKKYIITLTAIASFALSACSTKDKYDVARYYSTKQEQDSLLTSIVTYIFEKPTEASWKSRFENDYRPFYLKAAASQFSIYKYYIADDGTHYYYVIRPGYKPTEKRGAAGYFKMDKNFKLKGFREVFVTPVLPEKDVKNRCAFLFDEMVKNHNIDKYKDMKTYVQWPNKITYYDTTIYQWQLIPGILN